MTETVFKEEDEEEGPQPSSGHCAYVSLPLLNPQFRLNKLL